MFAILALALFTIEFDFSLAERNLTDKTVVITGAAQGIGYAIADNFLEHGAEFIIIVDKNETTGAQAAETLTSKYGDGKVVYKKCDIRTDLEETFNDIMQNYGCPDVLVNNAGILNESEVEAMLNTNTVALVEWTLKFRDSMRKDQTDSSCAQCGKGGVILNVASVDGHSVAPFFYSYTASKFAVIGFTRSIGHLYNQRQTGVDVIGICPDFTYTALSESVVVPENQITAFINYFGSRVGQEPDAVGRGAVEVFKNAETGTLWDIAGGNAPVPASGLTIATLEDIDSK